MRLKSTLITIFSLVFATTIANAQNDSIPGAALLPRQSDLRLEMDYLLGPEVPARWVWYAGRNIANNFEHQDQLSNGFYNITDLGFYYKITPGIAVGASIRAKIIDGLVNSNAGEGIGIRLHQRWYFDMRKRIRENRGANNFSGQYIGLSEEISTFSVPGIWRFQGALRPRFQLHYGIQHRFRQHLLVDMNIGFYTNTLRKRINSNEGIYLHFIPNFSISGALFPSGVPKGTQQHLRPRFHEQQRMIKVDLLGLYRQLNYDNSYIDDFKITTYAPYVALEQKWGHLPLSTELGIRAAWQRTRATFSDNNFIGNTFQGMYSLETRWFYHQLRKIAAGKAGNNLSGPFVAVQYQYQRERVQLQYSNIPNTLDAPINYHRTFLLWGYQQRFFKRGFAQLKLGACREAYQAFYPDRTEEITSHRLYSEVRVGLAF